MLGKRWKDWNIKPVTPYQLSCYEGNSYAKMALVVFQWFLHEKLALIHFQYHCRSYVSM